MLVPPAGTEPAPAAETIDVEGRDLPRPSEGGAIPAASVSYWLGRPDNAFDEVWTSPVDHHIVSTRPELLRDLRRLESRVEDLRLSPSGDGSASAARWLNRASRVYPHALVWLVLGLVGMLVRRPRNALLALSLAGAALLVVLATIVSVPPVPEIQLSLFPAFALLGVVGLVGDRRAPSA